MIKFDQKCFFLSPTANLKKTICLLTDAKYISFNPQRAQKNYIQYFWSHNKDVCSTGLNNVSISHKLVTWWRDEMSIKILKEMFI